MVGLPCISQRAITVMSAPDESRCIAVSSRMVWWEIARVVERSRYRLVESSTASCSRCATGARVYVAPVREGNNGASVPDCR